MKKHLKLIALFVVIALSAISLCSCQALDEAKEKQAFYTDDTKNEIVWKGETYQQIDPGKYYFISSYGFDDTLFVTDKDVPVLLSSYEGDYGTVLNDGTVISVNGKDYVIGDKYDELKKTIENAKLDHFYFTDYRYPDYEYDEYYYDRKDTYMEDENILLDDDVSDAINRALKLDEKDRAEYDNLNKNVKSLMLYRCDKDMVLQDTNKTVYLVRSDDVFYVWESYSSYSNGNICPIAKDDAKLIKEFYEMYTDCFEDDDLSYYFNDYSGSSNYGYGYGDSSTPVEGV